MAIPDVVKGMDAVDLFCARANIPPSKLTSSERFAIKHEKATAKLNRYGCWWFAIILVLILLFEVLAAPLVFDITCSEPGCVMIPPATEPVMKFPQGRLGANLGSGMNMSWNSTHILMETQCGAEFFNAALNITYTATPAFNVNCTPVVASVLTKVTSDYVSWCQGASHQWPSISPHAVGNKQQQHSEHVKISTCFMQTRYTIGYMQYFGVDQAPGWNYCTVTTPPQVFSRVNGTNSTPITGAVYSVSSNPYQNMINGFYTNSTHMIVVSSGNVLPNSGNIGFNTSVKAMA